MPTILCIMTASFRDRAGSARVQRPSFSRSDSYDMAIASRRSSSLKVCAVPILQSWSLSSAEEGGVLCTPIAIVCSTHTPCFPCLLFISSESQVHSHRYRSLSNIPAQPETIGYEPMATAPALPVPMPNMMVG